MTMRLPFLGFSSFRARVFWSVVPIVVGFLVFQAWMNIREHRRLVTEEFEKRGQALAANLGFASELGALSEDSQLLLVAMRGTLRNPDVAYVVVHAGDGRVLASGGRQAAIAAPPVEAITERARVRQISRARGSGSSSSRPPSSRSRRRRRTSCSSVPGASPARPRRR